jgi:RNA polymerase sigma factor (sigma-70 family)
MEIFDYKLLDAALDGDSAAREDFFVYTTKLLYMIVPARAAALRLKICRENVEDLVQGVLLSLIKDDFRKLREFERRSSFSTWLNTVAMNKVIDLTRRNQFHIDQRATSLDNPVTDSPDAPLLADLIADMGPMAYESLERKWLIDSVRAAKAACLDEEERLIIDLWSMRRSQNEIAALMNLNSDTVATKIHRAKKKLKVFLKEKYGDDVIEKEVPSKLPRPSANRRTPGEAQ